MKLTDGEKIIIAMLADIKAGLKIKGEIDDKRTLSSIYSGNLWSLNWDYSGLFDVQEVDDLTVKETADSMDMWGFIERSFAALNDADKDRVRATCHNHDPVFAGFDGNNERHFSVARHFVEDMDGRFTDFAGRDLNSHHPVIDGYMRMYEVFEPIRDQLGDRRGANMTADELISVLEARYHK